MTEGCSVELEPFWVLFATPLNNTAVVAIALEGKQVLTPSCLTPALNPCSLVAASVVKRLLEPLSQF